MQAPQIAETTTRIGKLTVKQFPNAFTIIAPRSANLHEFGVFYIFVVLLFSMPGSVLHQLGQIGPAQFFVLAAAVVGVCRATIRHVITITNSRVFIRREAFGLCWQEDAYALEHSAKLRFVPPGYGRRYARPSVLAVDSHGKRRCFAPFITTLEAAELLALLRTRLPMWLRE